MIIYTDKFLTHWQAGRQFWFVAIIRPKHRGDLSLIAHEKCHVKQWALTAFLAAWACAFAAFVLSRHLGATCTDLLPLLAVPPSTHGLLYKFLRKYRLWAEVQAYRVSLVYKPQYLDRYANVLAGEYRLRISTDQAKSLLT